MRSRQRASWLLMRVCCHELNITDVLCCMHTVQYRLSVRWLQETKIVNWTPHTTSAEMRDGEKAQKYCSRRTLGWLVPVCALVQMLQQRGTESKPCCLFFSPPPFFFMQKLCLLALKRYVSKCIQVKLAMDMNHVEDCHRTEVVTASFWPWGLPGDPGQLAEFTTALKNVKPVVLFRKLTLKCCIEAIPVLPH